MYKGKTLLQKELTRNRFRRGKSNRRAVPVVRMTLADARAASFQLGIISNNGGGYGFRGEGVLRGRW